MIRWLFLKGIFGVTAWILLFSPVSAGAAGNPIVWKMASLAPKNVGWAQQFQTLVVPWIRDATDDNLRFKFYWGGVMGNDTEYLKKMRIGQLQGAGITESGVNLACPEMSVLELPFLIKGYEEVDYLRTMMFSTFDFYFGQHGFKMLLWIDQDFDQCYSTRYQMVSLEDFRKMKFGNWGGPIETATIKALGAQPVPTNVTEAYTSLKTGLTDTAIGPAMYYAGSQLFTVIKYVNPMKIRYAPAIIVINRNNYEALPDEYQENLDSGRDAVQAAFVKAGRNENARALEAMIKYGVKRAELSQENKAAFIKATRPVWDQCAGQIYPKHLLEEVLRYLDYYRAGKPVKKPLFKETAPKGKAQAQDTPAKPAKQQDTRKSATSESAKESEDVQKLSAWERRKIQVRAVQEKLSALGYYTSTVDGVFGPITQEAVMKYQSDKGFAQSGSIDRRLLRSLDIQEQ